MYFEFGIWRKPTNSQFFSPILCVSFLLSKFISYWLSNMSRKHAIFSYLIWLKYSSLLQISMNAPLHHPSVMWTRNATILLAHTAVIATLGSLVTGKHAKLCELGRIMRMESTECKLTFRFNSHKVTYFFMRYLTKDRLFTAYRAKRQQNKKSKHPIKHWKFSFISVPKIFFLFEF